jgi:hypothetical protein
VQPHPLGLCSGIRSDCPGHQSYVMRSFSGENRHHGLHLVPHVRRNPWRTIPPLRETVLILLVLLVVLLGFQAYSKPAGAYADSNRLTYVDVISTAYVYRGTQGVVVMDKRNGNLWFFANSTSFDMPFSDPVLISRLPIEKLDRIERTH